jgi:rRNA maturation RNase YbeY
MITIKNNQRTIKVNTKLLKQQAQTLLDMLDYSDFDLGIMLVSDVAMQKYNATYRHKDKPTDILSFAHHSDIKAGERIVISDDEDEKNLGDLIIAPAYVQADAKRLRTTFGRRMERLLVHGICHLLGYDHERDEDYTIMLKKEMVLLRKLRNKNIQRSYYEDTHEIYAT